MRSLGGGDGGGEQQKPEKETNVSAVP
jgi:hypothetical protein